MAGDLRGMLLGGAVGDALGAPVEFLPWSEIRDTYGPAGITEFVDGVAPAGSITDDTQMTLFVFEGLIRAQLRWLDRGLCHPPSVIRNALLRWGATQGIEPCAEERRALNGWLFEQSVLHSRRGPGMTCLSAVAAIADGTDVVPAVNDSKGCGTVMRSAPFGVCNASRAYALAAESSAYTHGNDIAGDTAGCFAEMCRILLEGASIIEAVTRVEPRTPEVAVALAAAEQLVYEMRGEMPAPERLEQLGGGWVAEEALGIAVACAMLAEARDGGSNEDRFTAGVRLAVNHSGDSDSTGAIAGNLLGARYGVGAIPMRWLGPLEVRDIIEELVRAWETASSLPSMNAWILDDDGDDVDTSLPLQQAAASPRDSCTRDSLRGSPEPPQHGHGCRVWEHGAPRC